MSTGGWHWRPNGTEHHAAKPSRAGLEGLWVDLMNHPNAGTSWTMMPISPRSQSVSPPR